MSIQPGTIVMIVGMPIGAANGRCATVIGGLAVREALYVEGGTKRTPCYIVAFPEPLFGRSEWMVGPRYVVPITPPGVDNELPARSRKGARA